MKIVGPLYLKHLLPNFDIHLDCIVGEASFLQEQFFE